MKKTLIIFACALLLAACGKQHKAETIVEQFLDNNLANKNYVVRFGNLGSTDKIGDEQLMKMNAITHNDDSSWFQANASAQVVGMYATSDNFPDESVKTILSSLENSFGIRFRYDMEKNKVTAYLMRDVFRQVDAHGATKPVRDFFGTLHTVHPLTEKITGVRMKYSAESDGKEQMENIRRAKRDYDTDFDYIDYRLPHQG